MQSSIGHDDLLDAWLATGRPGRSARSGRTTPSTRDGGLRFAFYGRMSTDDFQDVASSRQWQRTAAEDLIAGHGKVVADYFDVGCSRRRPWRDRPQAAALLSAATDGRRPFVAIVAGEYERAFHGDQLANLAPVLAGHGVQIWLPETGGPFDHRHPAHQALTMLLGAQARREVLRARFEPPRRCWPKPASRVATWAGDPRTDTNSLTLGRIPTRSTPSGDGGCSGWIPIPPQPRSYGGSSTSDWPAMVSRSSPAC